MIVYIAYKRPVKKIEWFNFRAETMFIIEKQVPSFIC